MRGSSFKQQGRPGGLTILLLVVFISGVTTLAVETATVRLIANVYGTSNIVWAGVIGMTLLYLMVGYFLGGRWADRYPAEGAFFTLSAAAGFAVGIIPAVAVPVLKLAALGLHQINLTVSLTSALATAVLFVVPVSLLGAIPPFGVRQAIRDLSRSGRSVGLIYLLSTIGGLIGLLTTVLLAVPSIGTAATFALHASSLMAAALVGLWRTERKRFARLVWMPVLLVPIFLYSTRGPVKPPPPGTRLIHERETQYNYIQVVERVDGTRYLLLNEGLAVHSEYHPDRLITRGSWDFFLAAPYFNAPPYELERIERIAILGSAAGTSARQYSAVYGAIPIDGVEIDPGIVEVGREYFDMNQPNLQVHIGDARFVLHRLHEEYQVIAIDTYRGVYIPWQLTTVEFFQEVREHLSREGVVAINVGRTATDRSIVEALTATLLEVFPTVHTMDVPASFNTILVATLQPTQLENLVANFTALPPGTPQLLTESLLLAQGSTRPTAASGMVFTDERAPVELLADSLVLRVLFSAELSDIPPLGE